MLLRQSAAAYDTMGPIECKRAFGSRKVQASFSYCLNCVTLSHSLIFLLFPLSPHLKEAVLRSVSPAETGTSGAWKMLTHSRHPGNALNAIISSIWYSTTADVSLEDSRIWPRSCPYLKAIHQVPVQTPPHGAAVQKAPPGEPVFPHSVLFVYFSAMATICN